MAFTICEYKYGVTVRWNQRSRSDQLILMTILFERNKMGDQDGYNECQSGQDGGGCQCFSHRD